MTLFEKLHQPSTLLFLQTYPTPAQARAASPSEITALLKSCRYPNARHKASARVQELHRPQLEASAGIVRAKSRLMLSLVRQLLPLIEDIKSYDKEISTLFLKHPDHELWQSLPRVAKRLAPRLRASWGDDRARYLDAPSVLQELAGTAPVPFQSGNFACVKPLRNALHQFAWQTTLCEPWAAAYHQRKRAQGKSHSMVVRCLANVWVRIVRHVGVYGIPA